MPAYSCSLGCSVAALLNKTEHHHCLKRRETSCRHRHRHDKRWQFWVPSSPLHSPQSHSLNAHSCFCFHLSPGGRLMQASHLGLRTCLTYRKWSSVLCSVSCFTENMYQKVRRLKLHLHCGHRGWLVIFSAWSEIYQQCIVIVVSIQLYRRV